MPTQGHLGGVMTIAGQNQIVYTVPTGIVATVTIAAVNTGSNNSVVKMYISKTSTPQNYEAIEFNAVVPPGGVIERSCMPIGEGESIIINSTNSTLAVRVAGFETSNDA